MSAGVAQVSSFLLDSSGNAWVSWMPLTGCRSLQAVADSLGVAQQTYAHYEVGRVRMPVSLLPEVAGLFGVSTDELLVGRRSGAGKRGPTPKLQQQIERLTHLPKAKQKVVMEMLEGVLSQANR